MQVCNASCFLVYLTTSIPVFSEKKMRTEEMFYTIANSDNGGLESQRN